MSIALPAAADQALISEALSAGPPQITAEATVKSNDGKVLREGSNGWICYPGSPALGPRCNEPIWDEFIGALMAQKEPKAVTGFHVSYMLAGEPNTAGVSNSDPYASDPHAHGDYIKEGPHVMVLAPAAALAGLSDDPSDPVYVMWGGTPYAHIMVKTGEQE
ncbi:MAG: hypothetical protein R3190_04370 [Thermoanaerobaculia bacterium]|nr:hypothetical protein [Thermoanaerobaculia bacterium]